MVDVECESRWLLSPFLAPPSAERFAAHHLGDDPFIFIHGLKGRDAETRPVNGRWRICIASGLKRRDPLRFRWVVIHEVCEHHLRTRLGYQGEDIELAADALTAACAAPRDMFRRAVSVMGADLEKLGEAFRITQTAAGLRVGEVVRPTAVVAPKIVRVRAPVGEEIVWPAERELRRIAQEGGPGLRPVRITDQRGRTALLAETG